MTFADIDDRFARRMTYSGDIWGPLPYWSLYLIRLGASIVERASQETRVIVVLTVPTRAYAAAFCSIGVVMGCLSQPIEQDVTGSMERLRHLVGEAVTYRSGRSGGKIGRGILDGFETINASEYIVVRTGARTAIRIPATRAFYVEPSEVIGKTLPERGYTHEYRESLGFMDTMLEPSEKSALLTGSRLDCLVIGNESVLKQEMKEAPFAVTVDNKTRQEGRLRDVSRVRSMGCSVGYRSEVISGDIRRLPSFLWGTQPVVIFDGVRHFVRWYERFAANDWIVLLDRTDRRLGDGLAILEDVYIIDRLEDVPSSRFPQPPTEVQFGAFEVRRERT